MLQDGKIETKNSRISVDEKELWWFRDNEDTASSQSASKNQQVQFTPPTLYLSPDGQLPTEGYKLSNAHTFPPIQATLRTDSGQLEEK